MATMTISLADAKALSQGSVWSEFSELHQLEAILGQAAATAEQTGKPVTLTLVVEPK